jgi:hypothetical protein
VWTKEVNMGFAQLLVFAIVMTAGFLRTPSSWLETIQIAAAERYYGMIQQTFPTMAHARHAYERARNRQPLTAGKAPGGRHAGGR